MTNARRQREPSPRPMVYYHGHTHHEDGQRTVTFSINGKRHTYTLTDTACNVTEYLCKHVSLLKALNFAKSRDAAPTVATST